MLRSVAVIRVRPFFRQKQYLLVPYGEHQWLSHNFDRKTSRTPVEQKSPIALLLEPSSTVQKPLNQRALCSAVMAGSSSLVTASHLRHVHHGWPYREYNTRYSIVLRITGEGITYLCVQTKCPVSRHHSVS